MTKEIGGYIELDRYALPLLHEKALALNCGRSALAYLIRARGIRKILMPAFICDSVIGICMREGTAVRFYSIGMDLLPDPDLTLEEGEWLLLVNYYSQLGPEAVAGFVRRFGRVIVDNSQSYFDLPVPGADAFCSCRKYFGVADGAFLYTDARLDGELPLDESHERMGFILGRFERPASEFYKQYAENNAFFANEPVKRMSRLTENLLRGVDYEAVRARRESNFRFLDNALREKNALDLARTGTFMYPFLSANGRELRKKLIEKKIYIPLLWPGVLERADKASLEYRLADNILPLPIDQRYGEEEMKYILTAIENAETSIKQEE